MRFPKATPQEANHVGQYSFESSVLTGQQHYPSHSLKRNGDRGSGDPPGNDGLYPHSSNGGCSGPLSTPGGWYGGPPDDSFGGGSDRYSFSELGRWHRHDWHTQKHEQFEQSMISRNNLLVDILQCQQRMQYDATHALQAIHQSQWDCANDSLIDDIATLMENLNYILIGFWS